MPGLGAALKPAMVGLCQALTEAGVTATMTPAFVQTPGAWVSLVATRLVTLDEGAEADCAVFLIVGDTEDPLGALGVLLDKALDVIEPDGDVTTTSVNLPDSESLPALRVPVTLRFDT